MSVMSTMAEWLRRVWYLLNRRRLEDALQREMEAHRELMGEPVRFGNTLQLRERSRDVWGWAWLDALGRDVRFAARGLRRTKLFTLVATLSLALGLALTTSTVSIVNAYLIRSLPYPESDRLYHVMYAPPGPWEPGGMTALDWTSVADVVEFPISASGESFYVSDGGYTQSLRGMRVTRGFVEGLGVGVAAGRRPVAQDFTAGSEPIALVGHALWRDRFASDPGAIGRLIRAEAESRRGRPRRSGSSASSRPASTSAATAQPSTCWFRIRRLSAPTWRASAREFRRQQRSAGSRKPRGVRRRRRFRTTGPACAWHRRANAGSAVCVRCCSGSRSRSASCS